MATLEASARSFVPAAPAVVYDILADYQRGHPAILPKRYFLSLDVEEGGRGAGTRICVRMRLLGRTHTFRAEISEPQPGHILVERILTTGAVTTFTVEPDVVGKGSQVTIHTILSAGGLAGLLQSWIAPPLLRRVYREELANLAAYAQSQTFKSNG